MTFYKWEGTTWTCRELIGDLHSKGLYLGLNADALRYRLKQTKGNVKKALNYVYKTRPRTSEKFKCPDGKWRNNRSIAKHLGLSISGWVHRVTRLGFIKAWAMGKRIDPATKRPARRKPIGHNRETPKSLADKETLRQEKALRAMNKFNATEYEARL